MRIPIGIAVNMMHAMQHSVGTGNEVGGALGKPG